MRRLRPYQIRLRNGIFSAWQQPNIKNVLAVAPTGAGKTVIMGDVIRNLAAPTCAIAHRSELVSQIAYALARERVAHRIIGPDSLRRACSAYQMLKLGQNWVTPDAGVGVAGVDTLVKRNSDDAWFKQVQFWIGDEAHHFLAENKWGRGVGMFPNARGLGFTATPKRADGKGLDSLFQHMEEGPTSRELMDAGYLTGYRIFAPPSDVDYSTVQLSAGGDYSPPQLRAAVHKSTQFVGDVVKNYLRIAPGKLAVVFAVDVESAAEIAEGFRKAGTRAEVLTGDTDTTLRVRILQDFEARRVQVLVTVDIVSEGFDLPALEVVIMARKTESLSLFMQQFGRGLRVMVSPELEEIWDTFTDEQRRYYISQSIKPHMILIDHVQNVHRHGLPDSPRVWGLAMGTRRGSGVSDAIPTRVCLNPNVLGVGQPCLAVYERFRTCCPFCGFYPEITDRSAPEFVDGDLFELSPETLAAMRGDIAKLEAAPPSWPGAPQGALNKTHQERIIAQYALRQTMALWSGMHTKENRPMSEQYRRFYHQFGIDVLSAQALGRPEAEALNQKIISVLTRANVQKMM